MLDRATRKKELIALGAVRRAELVVERESLLAATRPQELGRAAMQRIADAALGAASRKTGLPLPEVDVAAILPAVAAGLSTFRSRNSQDKQGGIAQSLVRSGALIGLAAGAFALLRRRQRQPGGSGDDL